jgi:uncharacterized membrane protein YeaQ/YmgE (transglycosylase-associated protein family)
MSLGHWIIYLVVALICSLVAQSLVKRSVGGLVVSTLVGLGGAFLGAYLARALRAPDPLVMHVGGRSIPILWTIVGAALVTLVLSVIQRSSGPR